MHEALLIIVLEKYLNEFIVIVKSGRSNRKWHSV